MDDVIKRRMIEDIYYYIPFISFFHHKINVQGLYKNEKERIFETLPNPVKQSILFNVMVFLNIENIAIALNFCVKNNEQISKAIYEYNIFEQMNLVHKLK